jgi:CheY-like chemotaxis protein
MAEKLARMKKVVNILLVEDDDLDIHDIKRTMDKMGILHLMHVSRNGEEAIKYLEENHPDNQATWPDMILLDINMPKMNGLEFLDALRKRSEWKDLKVFMLTTSEEKVDKEAARNLGISGYIVKPLKFNNPSSMDSFHLMIDLMNYTNRI